MLTRTYTRTYRAEITECFVLGPADVTEEERHLLDALDAGMTTLTRKAGAILCRFAGNQYRSAENYSRTEPGAQSR